MRSTVLLDCRLFFFAQRGVIAEKEGQKTIFLITLKPANRVNDDEGERKALQWVYELKNES